MSIYLSIYLFFFFFTFVLFTYVLKCTCHKSTHLLSCLLLLTLMSPSRRYWSVQIQNVQQQKKYAAALSESVKNKDMVMGCMKEGHRGVSSQVLAHYVLISESYMLSYSESEASSVLSLNDHSLCLLCLSLPLWSRKEMGCAFESHIITTE